MTASLVDRYVLTALRRVPQQQRADIDRELRASIDDAVDARGEAGESRDAAGGRPLLETLSAAGFDVEANTLYPLLRRLEAQGLLTSAWNTDEARPRKFYTTTEQGNAVADALRTEWARLDEAIGDLSTEVSTPGSEK